MTESSRALAVTRARLAKAIASSNEDLSRNRAEIVVDTLFNAIKEALQHGDEVELRGFGSFRLRERKQRLSRNPRTGEPVVVPPKRVPFFRPGIALRRRLNEPAADEDQRSGS